MNKLLVEYVAKRSSAHVDYLVEGDDGFICSNKELDWDLTRLCGFKLKCDVVFDPLKIQFCSLRVCGDKLVPNITRTLHHYGYIIDSQLSRALSIGSKRSERKLREIQLAKAQSLLATSSGIPILQSIALQQIRILKGTYLNSKYYDWWESEFYDLSSAQATPITPEIRKYVEQEFDIPIKFQIELEKQIERCDYRTYDLVMPAPK